MIVVDASLLIALILREDNVADPVAVYETLLHGILAVPAHWPAEMTNALWANQRRGRIRPDRIVSIVEEVFSFAPTVEAAPAKEELPSLIDFANIERLTVYDAIYVQLALKLDATLATIDADMRRCAERLNIPLLPG